ncbi:unnamed protein product [Oppiella nova]|uniref:Uncharacterized protein n=1 Tax=Oppiella nova TaxID=334625 RepID=A0A7R9L7T7_9ACAR|nr:unnamed protein product [Oppiella nova]CAG2158204.1 unnamed protein product [Oppiella nova]
MGMIVMKQGQALVLEAIQPVKYTPLQQWINRGVNKAYVVKRYQPQLTAEQQHKLVKQAETYLNKPYDIEVLKHLCDNAMDSIFHCKKL